VSYPLGAAALAWILLAALPSSLVPLGDLAAERHAYLASAGAALLAGAALEKAWQRGGLWRAVTLVLILAMALACWHRALDWRTDRGLWRDSLRRAPGWERSLYNYGLSFAHAGEHARAAAWYRRAAPGSQRALIFSGLGFSLAHKAEYPQAAEAYARAILIEITALAAGDRVAQHRQLLAADTRNRAVCLLAMGRRTEATAACALALRWIPEDPDLQALAREIRSGIPACCPSP
jgi:tetratricopeptide (TPR) repeat protein